jgi:YVTN family beta-propeller protein
MRRISFVTTFFVLGFVCSGMALPEAALGASDGASVILSIPVGDRPNAITFGFDSIWVVNARSDSVSRVDPVSNIVVATISVGATTGMGIVAAEGAVWVTNFDANTVTRIDPATNLVAATIPVGSSPSGIDATPGAIWVAEHRGDPNGGVSRIDPATNSVVARIPLGAQSCCGPTQIGTTPDAVWVGVPNLSAPPELVRIDPDTTSVEAVIFPEKGAVNGGMAATGSDVWAAGGINVPSRLLRIDAGTNTISATINTGGGTGLGVAVGFGSVWTTGTGNGPATGNGFLLRIDPETNNVVEKLNLAGAPLNIAMGAGSVWVTLPGEGLVVRLAPA